MNSLIAVPAAVLAAALSVAPHGPSSSLYLQPVPEAVSVPAAPSLDRSISPVIAAYSLTAVAPPEPRRFALHDQITIIIRESTSTDFKATLQTDKKVKFDGKIDAFPDLQLKHLLDLALTNSNLAEAIELGVDYANEFDGQDKYRRQETITGRITASVIDVKPNGLLVLEARKFIQSDKENLKLVVTGTARPEDVTVDNTVLSTELANLNLIKGHEGELRRSTKKGLITRLFETIFNF